MLTCVIVATSEVNSGSGAIVQGGVAAPPEALIGRELPGALALEEQDAFLQGICVIMSRKCGRKKERKCDKNG